MDDLKSRYLEQYFSDPDRYFDFIYDIYEEYNELLEEKCLYFSNEISFVDFYDYYLSHMDKSVVDNWIISKHLRDLNREIGNISHQFDHPYEHPFIEDDEAKDS